MDNYPDTGGLATLAAWLAGLVVAHTERTRAVNGGGSGVRRTHSVVFTGAQALRRAPDWLDPQTLCTAWAQMAEVLALADAFSGGIVRGET